MIQAGNGRIFGGYTSQSWTKKDGNYDFFTQDDKAWIFSFDHFTQLKVKNPQHAIWNDHSRLCKFGSGADLGIYLDTNISGGWSSVGSSYELPAG